MIYVFTVVDSFGCPAVAFMQITQPDPLIIADSSIKNVSCAWGNDGEACVFIYGGSAPYLWQWSTGDTGLCASNLAAASYVFTATDAGGCTSADTIQIHEPPFLTDSIVAYLSHCYYIPQEICAYGIGGTPPYVYAWNGGAASATARYYLL
jgi:hypothetical protein